MHHKASDQNEFQILRSSFCRNHGCESRHEIYRNMNKNARLKFPTKHAHPPQSLFSFARSIYQKCKSIQSPKSRTKKADKFHTWGERCIATKLGFSERTGGSDESQVSHCPKSFAPFPFLLSLSA